MTYDWVSRVVHREQRIREEKEGKEQTSQRRTTSDLIQDNSWYQSAQNQLPNDIPSTSLVFALVEESADKVRHTNNTETTQQHSSNH